MKFTADVVFEAFARNARFAEREWPVRVTFDLGKRDSAWDPTSTKREISGPARVHYLLYQDGGVDASILPVHSLEDLEAMS